ncbi:hypothetical protein BC332_29180 [Capsicum chinense]|nr:hypothetical protein BC332_29180 [Capsicum chinense]
MIEIVLAVCSVVGGAFLNVLFEEAADLLKMFLKNKQLKKHCLQIVQSDAENKQASNQHVRKRLKVEGQLRNLAETSDQQKNEGGEKKKKGGGEENKKDGGTLSVVLKSCNCEGCATKVVKAISSVGGVEKVMRDEDSKKLTVIGKVDPVMLQEKVEWETHKKVELVSPIPKTDGKGKGGGGNGGDNGAGEEEKKKQNQNKEKDSRENKGGEDKKTKEKENEGGEKKKKGGEENEKGGGNLTVVLKPDCHCEGCVNKVVKAIRSVGVVEKVMSDVDSKKLTVIGKVDLVMLREKVAQETRKNVEVVSPIPKKDGKGKGGGDTGGDNVTGEEKKKMQKQNKEKDSRENTGEDKKTKEKEKKSTKKNEGGEKKKKEGGEENKKDGGNLSVVLKSCQCEGCVSTVVKAIRSIGGVEKVMCDVDSKKLTVIGKVDPVMLREEVERKTQKNVEVVSPIPKKDGKGKGGGDNGSDNGAGEEKKKMPKQNKEKDSRENTGGEDKKTKEKEPLITTAVLKFHCRCQGCIQKIDEIVTKFKGYKEMKVDEQKDLVTVTGSMDMKVLAETLKKHLKKEIEIVPPKKEGGEKKDKGGGDNGGGGGKGKGAGVGGN